MTEPIRLGTRASALARTQSATIGDLLAERAGRPWEEVLITTPGDDTTKPLDQPGSPGLFVSTLRAALLAGEVDVIVHSYKDLPSAPEPGLTLAAVPGRVDARDALVSRDHSRLQDLLPGSRVGTSSPRRAAALRRMRPDLQVVPIRGNVDTRIRKVREGQVDATILAVAGLTRIGRTDEIAELLDDLLPAPAQGALAIECRSNDQPMLEIIGLIDDPAARALTVAERQVLVGINAECTTAIGARAWWSDGELRLQAELTTDSGWASCDVSTVCSADDADSARSLGMRAAARLVASDETTARPVLLIRPSGNQADALALAAEGLASITEPYLRTAPTADTGPGAVLLAALRELAGDPTAAASTWLVATSPMAIAAWGAVVGLPQMAEAARLAAQAGVRAAATGERTAQTLRGIGFEEVMTPENPSAGDLLATLTRVGGHHVLFPCGSQALRTLPDGLRGLGWAVDEAVVYETAAVVERPGSADLVSAGEVSAVVLRSPSAAHALLAHARLPDSVALVCAGETTAAAVREAGLPVAAIAADPSPAAVAAAVAKVLSR